MKVKAYSSFGAGVQSTALALLVLNRDERLLKALDEEAAFWRWDKPSPLPEVFAFADTMDEPDRLYGHLEAMSELITGSGREIVIVDNDGEGLLEHMGDTFTRMSKGVSSPPFFVRNEDGSIGITRRQCTTNFKVRPLDRWARGNFGVTRKGQGGGVAMPTSCDIVYQWLGISDDEKQRMKRATRAWLRISHPLVFMRWRRPDCAEYVRAHGLEPIRSACVYCPYHSRSEWRSIREDKADWKKVLDLDDLLERAIGTGWAGVKRPLFLTRDCVRMRDLDLDAPVSTQGDLFGGWSDECSGSCGM